jgi:hypothetical protein
MQRNNSSVWKLHSFVDNRPQPAFSKSSEHCLRIFDSYPLIYDSENVVGGRKNEVIDYDFVGSAEKCGRPYFRGGRFHPGLR